MFTANLLIKLSIMLKNILKLNGAQQLSKSEQGSINGGGPLQEQCGDGCNVGGCPTHLTCVQVFCGPNGPFGGTNTGWTCTNAGQNK